MIGSSLKYSIKTFSPQPRNLKQLGLKMYIQEIYEINFQSCVSVWCEIETFIILRNSVNIWLPLTSVVQIWIYLFLIGTPSLELWPLLCVQSVHICTLSVLHVYTLRHGSCPSCGLRAPNIFFPQLSRDSSLMNFFKNCSCSPHSKAL